MIGTFGVRRPGAAPRHPDKVTASSSERGWKQGAKSWLQALAEGMGKTLGQKASLR
ncbi:hypothetical protein [Piscinibacter gummiphilus]|uniref:hypothetical protein n=1 Tax=Piscinibacter gummiphilus TaxID=946333 RepID=UPI0012FE33FE|nr:hypothetical protein [Piscinibacter gummiphilus]GLS97584.1 hypothetical protein GCM10007918_48760 [Piscinibacter gummiphilus]